MSGTQTEMFWQIVCLQLVTWDSEDSNHRKNISIRTSRISSVGWNFISIFCSHFEVADSSAAIAKRRAFIKNLRDGNVSLPQIFSSLTADVNVICNEKSCSGSLFTEWVEWGDDRPQELPNKHLFWRCKPEDKLALEGNHCQARRLWIVLLVIHKRYQGRNQNLILLVPGSRPRTVSAAIRRQTKMSNFQIHKHSSFPALLSNHWFMFSHNYVISKISCIYL